MSTVETTLVVPEGWAFAATNTSLNLEHQNLTVGYNTSDDNVHFHLGKLYLSLTRPQWEAIKAAADSVITATAAVA